MTEGAIREYAAFAPRPVAFHGIREHAGHRLKTYSIRYGDESLSWPSFEAGIAAALDELPEANPADGRPGLGFLIAHRGRGMDYTVLGWWARENELPLRIRVREAGGSWRPADHDESVCVWDLEIVWRERQAYVETVLGEGGPEAAEAYLARLACPLSGDPG